MEPNPTQTNKTSRTNQEKTTKQNNTNQPHPTNQPEPAHQPSNLSANLKPTPPVPPPRSPVLPVSDVSGRPTLGGFTALRQLLIVPREPGFTWRPELRWSSAHPERHGGYCSYSWMGNWRASKGNCISIQPVHPRGKCSVLLCKGPHGP